jgi:SAM-dependent methyltransferase
VLVRADERGAYPVVDGVPVLLAPELLAPDGADDERRVLHGAYAGAYADMDYYNAVARGWVAELERRADEPASANVDSDDPVDQGLALIALSRHGDRQPHSAFPEPPETWLHLRFEAAALRDAYGHLTPVQHSRILQLGGLGLDAVKFLLAGAAEVWLVSPILDELDFGLRLARHCGVEDRLRRVCAIAEELPFEDASFDRIYAGGSVHHMVIDAAMPECVRVLRPGGRFAAVEPWRAPGYGLGIRLIGKREPVHCQPLTSVRVAPFLAAFERGQVIHHGALTRYPAIALAKLGAPLSRRTVRFLTRLDDAVASRLPAVRRTGSSVALLATRDA